MVAEETPFDVRLRKAALQTTRRAAFSALIGGALLFADLEKTDARKSARRQRRRQRRQRQSNSLSLRGMTIQVDNTHGVKDITVQHGWFVFEDPQTFNATIDAPSLLANVEREGTVSSEAEDSGCCVLTTSTIPAGQAKTFEDLQSTTGLVFINSRYWFQFENPSIGRPFVNIALDGMWDEGHGTCCRGKGIPAGATVEKIRAFSEGDTRTYNIQNTALFTVRRHDDTATQKVFTVTPPPIL